MPLTAIPTVIRYSEKVGVNVTFHNGTKRQISLDEIPGYVTERENPKNTKGVQEVVIGYPSEFLRQGVILVDTPGVGSIYQHNTDAAYAYLPHSDAAIFTISIDAPLDKNEIEYLKDITKHVTKLFFVLNKIDIASPEDVAEALEFTRETLRAHLGEGDYELVPLSARQALLGRTGEGERLVETSGIRGMEEVLGDFIRNSKGRLILESGATRALRIINELELELKLWQRAMDTSLKDLDKKIVLFLSELDKLEQEREDSIYLLYREVDRLAVLIEEDINEFRQTKKDDILHELEEFYQKESPGKPVKELTTSLNSFSRDVIQVILNEKRSQEGLKVRKEFEKVAIRFFSRIEDVVDRMMSVSAEIFDIPVEKSITKEYILGTQKFFFHFEEHPTFIPSLESVASTGLLPKALIGGQILKNAKKKLLELFDRNCGRVRYDLVEGIKEGARDVAGELRLRADAVSQGLRATLQKAWEERDVVEVDRQDKLKAWEKEYEELLQMKEAVGHIIASL